MLGENICQRMLSSLPEAETVSEIAHNIQTGIESSMDIWHLLMDNPLVLGMLIGGVSVNYWRRFLWKQIKRSHASSQK